MSYLLAVLQNHLRALHKPITLDLFSHGDDSGSTVSSNWPARRACSAKIDHC